MNHARAFVCVRLARPATKPGYASAHFEPLIYNRCCHVKGLSIELFGNSSKEHGERSNVALNIGGTWKLSAHLNLLFAGGRDIVGNTTAMGYIGLQILTK